MGKEARRLAPRSSHADWQPAADRPNPLDLLQAQDEGRLQRLLPIKYGRMLASPFAFLRGSAVVMAADTGRLKTAAPVGVNVTRSAKSVVRKVVSMSFAGPSAAVAAPVSVTRCTSTPSSPTTTPPWITPV